MAEYIEREAALVAIESADPDIIAYYGPEYGSESCFSRDKIKEVIQSIPAADAAPVVHGYWDWVFLHARGYVPFCSVCRNEPYRENDRNMPKFCSCGAKMQEAR